MPETQTKYCGKCGEVKTASEFYKNHKTKDGLSGFCKECSRESSRKRYTPAIDNRHNRNRQDDTGIDSWKQIGSILRQMAESQLAINHENAALEKRISLVKSYSEEFTEPLLSHQTASQAMLTAFLKKKLSGIKTTVRRFQFGQVFWNKGKITIKLNTELAKNRLGKP